MAENPTRDQLIQNIIETEVKKPKFDALFDEAGKLKSIIWTNDDDIGMLQSREDVVKSLVETANKIIKDPKYKAYERAAASTKGALEAVVWAIEEDHASDKRTGDEQSWISSIITDR